MMRTRIVILLLAGGVFAAACSSDGSGALIEDTPDTDPADYSYLIPIGTADRIAAGDPVEILPGQLDVEVGEVIQIINEDDEGHFVGIFYVGAGETVTQRFASPGEFIGNCTVHPSGSLTLTVHS